MTNIGGNSTEERLQKLLGLRPADSRITVTQFDDWQIDAFPDPDHSDQLNVLAVGVGEPRIVEFDDGMLQAALQWLASDRNGWLAEMRRAMGGPNGELTRPELLADEQVILDAVYDLLYAVGDLGLSGPATVNGQAISAVDTVAIPFRLAPLRSVLLLALSLQNVDQPAKLWRSVERELEKLDPAVASQLHQRFGEPGEPHFALARLLIVAGMSEFHVGGILDVGSPGGPVRAESGPRTPEQLIWFTIALSAGAIIPPKPMPGVFQCAYHLCRKVFVSRRLGVVGKRRFCSVAHGNRFYAARRMKEKSNSNTAKPQTED